VRDVFSRRYSTAEYAAQGNLVHWSTIKNRGGHCDECVMTFYEAGTPQQGEPPYVARTIRRVRDTRLYLCHTHATAWKDRDRDY
jgi:hypothetical protein